MSCIKLHYEKEDFSIFQNVRNGSGVHSASFQCMPRFFPGIKQLGAMLTTHFHLALSLRMSGAECLHGVVRDNLALTFTFIRTGSFSRKLIF